MGYAKYELQKTQTMSKLNMNGGKPVIDKKLCQDGRNIPTETSTSGKNTRNLKYIRPRKTWRTNTPKNNGKMGTENTTRSTNNKTKCQTRITNASTYTHTILAYI